MKPLLNFLFPRHCVLCRAQLSHPDTTVTTDLCPGCEDDLPKIDGACLQCGIPLPDPSEEQKCGQCLQHPPHFDQTISIFHYHDPIRWMIQQMKFSNKPSITQILANAALTSFNNKMTKQPEALIPVPLHPKREFERGFNQSREIARYLSKSLNCSVDNKLLQRTENTPHQTGLDAHLRKRNVRNAFRIRKKISSQYQHVAIVDDVMSTGSTVNEIARILKKEGIKRVDVWVLARAENK